jgi:acetyl-CoA C-acetyltransferase
MPAPVYVLGGYQTDFARNWSKENKHISAMFQEAVTGALQATRIPPEDVEVGHVGNFAAELYAMQGHLGAFLVEVDPAFRGLPTARHEAACASGSIAILAASAEIEAGRYDLAMVLGVEQMKTVDSARGGDYLPQALRQAR